MECEQQMRVHYTDVIRDLCSSEKPDINIGFHLGIIYDKMANEAEDCRQVIRDVKKFIAKKEKKKQEKHDKKWIKTG